MFIDDFITSSTFFSFLEPPVDRRTLDKEEKKKEKEKKKEEKERKQREKTGREHLNKKQWAAHNKAVASGKECFQDEGNLPPLAVITPSFTKPPTTTQPQTTHPCRRRRRTPQRQRPCRKHIICSGVSISISSRDERRRTARH